VDTQKVVHTMASIKIRGVLTGNSVYVREESTM
jgi:hypothetical protein